MIIYLFGNEEVWYRYNDMCTPVSSYLFAIIYQLFYTPSIWFWVLKKLWRRRKNLISRRLELEAIHTPGDLIDRTLSGHRAFTPKERITMFVSCSKKDSIWNVTNIYRVHKCNIACMFLCFRWFYCNNSRRGKLWSRLQPDLQYNSTTQWYIKDSNMEQWSAQWWVYTRYYYLILSIRSQQLFSFH